MNRTDQMVLQFREVLEETERFAPDDLETYQQKLLAPLLLHARKHAPFYRNRLDPVFTGDEIDFSRWTEIPILTREDAVRNRLKLRAEMVPPTVGKVTEKETSGSLGRPLRFFVNDLLETSALAMTDRLYRWWEFDGSKTMINFVPPRLKLSNPEQTLTHGWRSGFLEGKNIMRSSAGDIDSHIDWLRGIRADYMVAYPSMIRALAEQARERNVRLGFERVISRGWVVDPEAWPLCREVFGAPLVDWYGANEIGSIACQCPHCGDYHVNSEAVLVEILDQEGASVGPGENGRVVLTCFYNYAMPFIRYEIGDVAQSATAEQACQITLPRLNRIMGRYRNIFTLRDGRTIYPNPPMSRFRDFLPYRQIQVVQTEYDLLEVRYVPGDDDRGTDREGLESWLRQELDADFSVRLVPVEAIPALPSGKFEEFVSRVERRGGPRKNG